MPVRVRARAGRPCRGSARSGSHRRPCRSRAHPSPLHAPIVLTIATGKSYQSKGLIAARPVGCRCNAVSKSRRCGEATAATNDFALPMGRTGYRLYSFMGARWGGPMACATDARLCVPMSNATDWPCARRCDNNVTATGWRCSPTQRWRRRAFARCDVRCICARSTRHVARGVDALRNARCTCTGTRGHDARCMRYPHTLPCHAGVACRWNGLC